MSDLLVKELVANTAYLRAQRQDRNELRKERLSLTLPLPKSSATLQEAEGKQYESLCEQQPIGRELFRQFLLSCNPQYAAAIEFLDELRGWSSAVDDDQEKTRHNLVDKFCHPESRSFLSFLKGDSVETGKRFSNILDESSVNQMREATRDFLRGKPFSEFLRSPFFFRFLQWKEYERQKISDKYFREFRTLGKGGFGEVCAVQVRTTGQMYACKKLDKRRLKKKGGERLALQEKRILAKVNNLFIVNLAYAYENNTHLCLVMDLMNGGDLRFHIYELGERGIRTNRVVYYAAQMTMGLLHLHSLNIVYRDLKPENVLLDARGHCRLSDLGLAVELPNGKTICQKAGTTGYMAPEMLRQQYYSTSVDWWALGCCIYEMVAARLPFRDFREKVLKSEVTRRTLEDLCKFHHKGFDPTTKDVVCCLLKKKVAHRLGCQCDDPRKHPFFKTINFHLLEARRLEPPWMPKPNVVYAEDTNCFNDTSEVGDIELDAKDENFYKEFSTGAVTVSWQKEMIDSGLFEELNRAERNGHERAMAWKSKMCVIL